MPSHLVARARTDLRTGLPVVLTRLAGNVLVLAAETLDEATLQRLRVIGAKLSIAVTDWRAKTLKARPYDGDLARLQVPEGAGVAWIQSVADPVADLASPMRGPFREFRDGPADAHRAAIALCKAARLLPCAVIAEGVEGDPGLTRLGVDVALTLTRETSDLTDVVMARLPIEAAENTRLHIFRPYDGGEEHYAVEIGEVPRDRPVLSRLHSACFTGDVIGSLKCDCGPQLRAALAQMGTEGAGVLLYLNQEGRGIGLANKMRAYALQNQGFDTVDANHRLGFEDDERDFRIGAALLTKLGFSSVRLLTNNPGKVAMLEGCGLEVVERVPLKVGLNPLNAKYLETKAKRSGHLL